MNIKIYNEMQNILQTCPNLIEDKRALLEMISVRFGVEVNDVDIDTISDAVLENYFTKVWQPSTKKYKYSGLSIIDEVNAMKPERVLDVGCGYNEFKGKINNLYGIDAFNERADERVDIMDYFPGHVYDVLICFGSINFGNTQKVYGELAKAVAITKIGGLLYFRVNPGIQHDPKEAEWIEFFPWTPEFVFNSAKELGCSVLSMRNDSNRIYFALRKDK